MTMILLNFIINLIKKLVLFKKNIYYYNKMIKINNTKNIDNFIPLGEECYTSQSIDSKFNSNINLRNFAFPFDYVGHTYIESIFDKIINMVETRYLISKEDIEIKLFGDKYFFSDKKYNLHYWHDFSHSQMEDFTEGEWNIFLEKYQRRYERFLQNLESGKKILFLSVNHFDNIYNGVYKKESLIKLYLYLKTINKNIQFLGINFDNNSFDLDDLHHVKIDFLQNDSFEESKNNFQEELYKFIKNYKL